MESAGITVNFYYSRKHQSVMEAMSAAESIHQTVEYCTEHIGPLPFYGDRTFNLIAPFGAFCGTGRTVKGVVLGRGKWPSTLPATPPSDSGQREQRGAQASVQGKDSGAEPFADQGVGDTLRTDTFLAVVQEQAVSAVIVAALMHQPPGCAVLLIGHVGDFGYNHFTCFLGKILKTSDLRF